MAAKLDFLKDPHALAWRLVLAEVLGKPKGMTLRARRPAAAPVAAAVPAPAPAAAPASGSGDGSGDGG